MKGAGVFFSFFFSGHFMCQWTPARNSKLLENSLSFDCRTAYTPGASIAKIFSPFLATPPEILDFAYFYPRIQLCSFSRHPPSLSLIRYEDSLRLSTLCVCYKSSSSFFLFSFFLSLVPRYNHLLLSSFLRLQSIPL